MLLKRFYSILDVILFSNLFISLATVYSILSTYQLTHTPLNKSYLLLAFFSTLFIYNLQRLNYNFTDIEVANHRRNWIKNHQPFLKIIVFISALGTIFCVLFLINSYKTLLILTTCFVLSLLYFKFLTFRKYAYFKILLLGLVWTIVTVYVPLINNTVCYTPAFYFIFISRLFFFTGICLPFDIRDYAVDINEKIATMAILIGEKSTLKLSLLCIALYATTAMIGYVYNCFSLKACFAIVTTAIFTTLVLLIKNKTEYTYVLLLDGTIYIEYLLQ